jgi:hypothetical protein
MNDNVPRGEFQRNIYIYIYDDEKYGANFSGPGAKIFLKRPEWNIYGPISVDDEYISE